MCFCSLAPLDGGRHRLLIGGGGGGGCVSLALAHQWHKQRRQQQPMASRASCRLRNTTAQQLSSTRCEFAPAWHTYFSLTNDIRHKHTLASSLARAPGARLSPPPAGGGGGGAVASAAGRCISQPGAGPGSWQARAAFDCFECGACKRTNERASKRAGERREERASRLRAAADNIANHQSAAKATWFCAPHRRHCSSERSGASQSQLEDPPSQAHKQFGGRSEHLLGALASPHYQSELV